MVAVVGPGVRAVGGQVGEAASWQGAKERVQFLSGRVITETLLGWRCGIGEGEADGVVVDEAEGQSGLVAGQPGPAKRCQECLG